MAKINLGGYDVKGTDNKTRTVKAVAIVCILTLMSLIVLPGCNFIGQTDENTSAGGTTAVVDANGNELCCPVCSKTDITGPDADGNYVCNSCGAKWSYDDDKIDIVNDNGDVITQLDASSGYVSGGSSGGSSNNGGNSGNKSNSTTKKPSSTTTTAPTTTKSFKQQMAEIQDRWKDVIKFKVDEDGNITADSPTGKDTGLFGFKYSTKDKVFITAEDAWQRNFGFEVTYDNVSGLGAISYDTVRVYFEYGGLEWMIQLWKGQYGFVFIGSEIGIYHRPAGSAAGTMYQCATDETKLNMSMNVYRRESSTSNKFNLLFTRSPANTWWLTGFTPGTLRAGSYVISPEYTAYLKVDATINFKDAEMAKAFMGGLDKVTVIDHNSPDVDRNFKFSEVSASAYSSSTKNGRYALDDNGTSVHFSWR